MLSQLGGEMTQDVDIAELERAVHRVYAEGISAEEQPLMASFTSDPSNIAKLETIMANPSISTYLSTFASSAIQKIVDGYLQTMSIDDQLLILGWIHDLLQRNSGTLPSSVISTLAKTFASIILPQWPTSSEYLNSYRSIFDLFDGRPPSIIAGLEALNAIIDFASSYSTDKHDGSRSSFASSTILQTYELANELMRESHEESSEDKNKISEMALILASSCLGFSTSFKQFKDFKSYQVMPPQAMYAVVSEPKNVDFFFDLYFDTFQVGCLKCIHNIIAAAPTAFKGSARAEVFNRTLIGLTKVVTDRKWQGQGPQIFQISALASTLATNLTSTMMRELGAFQPFATSYSEMTLDVISNIDAQSLDTLSNFIVFWASLENNITNDHQTDVKEGVYSLITRVVFSTIEFLFTGLERFHDSIIELIWSEVGLLSPLIETLRPLMRAAMPSITSYLHDTTMKKLSELGQSMADQSRVAILQSQLALLLQLLTNVLLLKMMTPNDTGMARTQVLAFADAILLLKESALWIEAGMASPIFEQSSSLFIAKFKYTLFGTFSPLTAGLYSDLQKSGSFSSMDQAITFLQDRLLGTFKFATDQKSLILSAISALKDCPSSKEVTTILLRSHCDVPFLSVQSNKQARINFNSVLFGILQADLSIFPDFMAEFDSKMASPSTPIWGVCCDFTGLFSAVKSSEQFSMLYDWLFPNRFNYFINAASKADSLSISCLAKFLSIMVQNKPISHISFPYFSAGGIVLFKACAEAMMPMIERLSTLEPEDLYQQKLKPTKYILNALSSLIGGGYVLFEAFEIYNDSCFSAIVLQLFSLLNSLDIEASLQYEKFGIALMKFLKAICQYRLENVLKAMPNSIKGIMELILIGMHNQLSTISVPSIDAFGNVGQFIADNAGSAESTYVLDQCGQYIASGVWMLWAIIVNQNTVSIASGALKSYLAISRDFVGSLKARLSEQMSQAKLMDLNDFFDAFEMQVYDSLASPQEQGFVACLNRLCTFTKGVTLRIDEE